MNLLERAQKRTADQRQAKAAELLDRLAITTAIENAAAAGQDYVLLYPASPIRFRHTPAAIDAEKWLKGAGFRPSWTDHPRVLHTPPTTPAGDALHITWEGAAWGGGSAPGPGARRRGGSQEQG